jgi:hypothetical protein
MKWVLGILVGSLCLTTVFFSTAWADAGNAYPNGIEGIKAASTPPPGYYYRMYAVFYNADTLTDNDGKELDLDFDLSLFVNAHRFLWVSNHKILGADYAADIALTLMNVDLEIGKAGVDASTFGVGDIFVEPLILAWHGDCYDAAFGAGFFIPTGKYEEDDPASPGSDMWTGMFSMGGTAYFDAAKTLSASILSRYEFHGEQNDTEVTPGNDFHFEWGVGKTIKEVWEAGMAGYCQWQVTDDSGPGTDDVKDSVYAFGPEVNLTIPSQKMVVSFRGLTEFGAEDKTEGYLIVLALTKIL